MSFSALSTCSQLDGHDLRQCLFEERKRVLPNLLRRQRDGISFNEIGAASKSPPSSSAEPTVSSFRSHQNYLNSRYR
jgi:hypothetical protein